MQKEIKIVVAVNDENHANLIREEIINIIRERTTIYAVTYPCTPKKFIDELHKEIFQNRKEK